MMARKSTRQQILEAADDLFYRQGFEVTSFADIAAAVRISRGNFYYHFKSKDEILEAVVDKRLEDRKTLLGSWEENTLGPASRIECFIKIVTTNQAKIMAYGCPVGTLTTELAKLDHVSRDHANQIMVLFHKWLIRQFEELGFTRQADEYALHILSWSQGVAVLAQTFRDENFVQREVDQIMIWLTRATAQGFKTD